MTEQTEIELLLKEENCSRMRLKNSKNGYSCISITWPKSKPGLMHLNPNQST
jgi:hypothetical protein